VKSIWGQRGYPEEAFHDIIRALDQIEQKYAEWDKNDVTL
jgi:hypothetical protein